jgi:hypothetical protein
MRNGGLGEADADFDVARAETVLFHGCSRRFVALLKGLQRRCCRGARLRSGWWLRFGD